MISAPARLWLQSYQIDPYSGFLPPEPPLNRLPGAFGDWEEMAQHLPELLQSRQVDARLAKLPAFPLNELHSPAEWERAMQLLSFLGHAYLRQNGEDRQFLPSILAQPWVAVASQLQRPPVIAHPAFVLYNWQKIDPEGPLNRDNIRTLQLLGGSSDEQGFILSTAAMEIIAARILCSIAMAREACQSHQPEIVERQLYQMSEWIEEMRKTFGQMRTTCDPFVFYHEIRPFIASFHNLEYQGVDHPVRSYDGGSAAQSSIFQSLDAALGVIPEKETTRTFLVRMRKFMPTPHARFIEDLEGEQLIPQFCIHSDALQESRNVCLEAMVRFRNEHLKIVAQYIIAPARGQAVVGTGGTSPMPFLKSVRNATKQSAVD